MRIDRAEPARSPHAAFPEVVDRDWFGRWCHLSEADLGLVRRHRSDTTRLGFATQLVTVRAIGTFLAEPAEVRRRIHRLRRSQALTPAAIASGRGNQRFSASARAVQQGPKSLPLAEVGEHAEPVEPECFL